MSTRRLQVVPPTSSPKPLNRKILRAKAKAADLLKYYNVYIYILLLVIYMYIYYCCCRLSLSGAMLQSDRVSTLRLLVVPHPPKGSQLISQN